MPRRSRKPSCDARDELECPMRFLARLCTNEACRLRFPVDADSGLGLACPLCGEPTIEVGERYDTPSAKAQAKQTPSVARELHGVLDNIRSLRNVGAIFRCADGSALNHLHLCGFTPTPEHPKLDKTALGAQHRVPWSRASNTLTRVKELQSQGIEVWAIEGGEQADSVFEHHHGNPPQRLALVVGHEVSGVDAAVLAQCDRRVQVPMLGIKASLNVSVAFGIVMFLLRFAGGPTPEVPT